jgi:hypothetical protein
MTADIKSLDNSNVVVDSQKYLRARVGIKTPAILVGPEGSEVPISGGSSSGPTVIAISSPTTAAAVAGTTYLYLISGTTTLTFPTAVGNTSTYIVKRTGTNTVTVNTTSSQTMDGSTSLTLNVQYQELTFVSDNANWQII